MRTPLPETLVEHALNYRGPPATPAAAATIVLLRDGDEGLETYLLRRSPKLAFAPSFDVFPGGRVDAADSDVVVGWAGPDEAAWSRQLECDEDTARAVVVAAVRETFEESGVLLASGSAEFWNSPSYVEDRRRDRAALEGSEISLAPYLARHGLVLRSDHLAAWSHWLTPEFEPRRYATWFLVAAVPPGQAVDHVAGESDHARWVPLRHVTRAVDAGEIKMLPPTITTCRELEGMDVATVMAMARTQTPARHTATLIEENGRYFLQH